MEKWHHHCMQQSFIPYVCVCVGIRYNSCVCLFTFTSVAWFFPLFFCYSVLRVKSPKRSSIRLSSHFSIHHDIQYRVQSIAHRTISFLKWLVWLRFILFYHAPFIWRYIFATTKKDWWRKLILHIYVYVVYEHWTLNIDAESIDVPFRKRSYTYIGRASSVKEERKRENKNYIALVWMWHWRKNGKSCAAFDWEVFYLCQWQTWNTFLETIAFE